MGFSRQEYWSGVPLPSPDTQLIMPNSNLEGIQLGQFLCFEFKFQINCYLILFSLFCICCQVVDGGALWATVHGVARSRTRLSDFTFNFHFHALEKAMATHSSVFAWRIPGTGEPGGLPSMGSHRVGHD